MPHRHSFGITHLEKCTLLTLSFCARTFKMTGLLVTRVSVRGFSWRGYQNTHKLSKLSLFEDLLGWE